MVGPAVTASKRSMTGSDRALREWVSGALASDLVTDFQGPWDLKLARCRTMRFPAPADVRTAAEAALWENRAQAVAAECTTRGQAAAWLVPSLTATVLGAATVAASRGVPAGSPWGASIVASGLSAVILTWIGLVIAASIALPVVRDLHMRAPTWTARAQAYGRRRAEIDSTSDERSGRRWWARARGAAARRP